MCRALLLAQCGAFVGTQLSNLDAATVELMSVLRYPPTYFDVLNDVHRGCLSDEQVWYAGIHPNRRPLAKDSILLANGSWLGGWG